MAFKTLPQYPESADFRAGAIAASKAIREIPELVGSDDLDQSTADYFATRDSAIMRVIAAAGPISDKAAGALAAVAEMLVMNEQNGLFYELGNWHGEMELTPDDRQAERTEFALRIEAADREHAEKLRAR